jgi:hypothetical protein
MERSHGKMVKNTVKWSKEQRSNGGPSNRKTEIGQTSQTGHLAHLDAVGVALVPQLRRERERDRRSERERECEGDGESGRE